jgi:hypothetical protein
VLVLALPVHLPAGIDRIVQEALTNVVKYYGVVAAVSRAGLERAAVEGDPLGHPDQAVAGR